MLRSLTTACVASLVLLLSSWCSVPLDAAEERAKKEDWDVNAAHGSTRTVTFTTDEGTWMPLDVHPDGRHLVFALLGDLYLLPIEGGEAVRLTEGPAFDTQPRFSPDGRQLAFASDGEGSENLWLADFVRGEDGTYSLHQPRQLSDEDEVTGPEWTPDGDYLIGRKRTTGQSSIGVVELRLWHVRGGEGVVLTDTSKLRDAAAPQVSPDGRFVYFAGRAGGFRYDRNVYDGIWQLARLDRRNGEVQPLTDVFGGAAAPRLSPDGRQVAFVRRVDAATELQLLDLQRGTVRQLARGVTRDQMQGFAVHGNFPGYAWMPDGASIVATAEGKIWRFDVATGLRTAIPFQARVEQEVHDALRWPRRLQGPGTDEVRARLLRWPVEVAAGDGKLLLFSAVGHLYGQRLDATGQVQGEPFRLTDAEQLEYAPALSPDGRRLAYTSWDDSMAGGHLWLVDLDAATGQLGEPRRLTQYPGQYANPSFSPDGRRLVYLAGSGSPQRGRSLEAELWHRLLWIDVESDGADSGAGFSEPHFIVDTSNRGSNRAMTRPVFSPDGERVFFVDSAEGGFSRRELPPTQLVSVRLDGSDRREHLQWPKAEEAIPSPDGRWVLYRELQDAYLVPLPLAGSEPVEVKAKGGPLPVVQLTDGEGALWLNWAEAGSTLTWIHGPMYSRVPLARALAQPDENRADENRADENRADEPRPEETAPELEGEAEKEETHKPALQVDQTEITLRLPRHLGRGVVAYRGARVVPMTASSDDPATTPIIEDAVLLVDGHRLRAVGPASEVEIPADAEIVDLTGKTVIPGFVDIHGHPHYATLDILPRRPWQYHANLAYGVTTIHDPSAPNHEVFTLAEMVEAGEVAGPRMFSTGYVIYGATDAHNIRIKSLDDARKQVRRLQQLGAISVKSYEQPQRQQRQWLIQAGREAGMMVMPEGGGNLEANITMIHDGHTTIEHAVSVAPLYQDVRTLFAESGTAYTPTLEVVYGGLSGFNWFFQHYDVFRDANLARFVPQDVLQRETRIRDVMAPDEDWQHLVLSARDTRDILRAGGRVCLGSHGEMQGLGAHWEIWSFVQGGMTPAEALAAATRLPAEVLGLDGDIGTLEAGKLADFVVLGADPLEKIENTDSVELVVKGGVRYTPDELAIFPVP